MTKTTNPVHGTPTDLSAIQITPGKTREGRSASWRVEKEVDRGAWRLESVAPERLGLARPLEIYRAIRRADLIKPWNPQAGADYCPAHWADLAIGRGACGLRCRACFLIMTHRIMCDPSRHVVYENVDAFERAVRRWLWKPDRRTLGLGIDCSDSLLYEGVTGHARRLIPNFADSGLNPHGVRLLLLTKSVNVRYLDGLPTNNVIVSFSLNPEPIADLWEGKFDDGLRVTPCVRSRLGAALEAQSMGFEVRWRVDPIFPVEGWGRTYSQFFKDAAVAGHQPTRITLGTYRETQPSLTTFARLWGLPPMEYENEGLVKEGDHWHLPAERRVQIYAALNSTIRNAWRGTRRQPTVALCKETIQVRNAIGLNHSRCNCGP